MAEVRTASQLQDAIDKELSWRKKELKAFEITAKKGGEQAKFYIRAGVALLYAHWEGFVKESATIYLNFVQHQGLTYRELLPCFSVLGLKGNLDSLIDSRKSIANIQAFNFIKLKLEEKATLKLEGAIRTESNLTSKVLSNILAAIGIVETPYQTKFNLIDQSLVLRRNKIAHGEYLDIKPLDFSTLITEVLILFEMIKNDILNAAIQSRFKFESSVE